MPISLFHIRVFNFLTPVKPVWLVCWVYEEGVGASDHGLSDNKTRINNNYSMSRSWICSGNRTEWSPIQSVIIRVITNSDDRAAGVRFVYHEYDYRLNWTTRSPIIN